MIAIRVDRESSGEYARYAADLCRAWSDSAEIRIWLDPGDPAAFHPALRLFVAGGRFTNRTLRAFEPQIFVAIGDRAGRQGARVLASARETRLIYVALSPRLYADTSLWAVASNYCVQRSILARADRVVVAATGNLYQFLLREWTHESRYFLLPKMWDPDEFPNAAERAALRETMAPDPADTLVVYAGPLEPHTRVDWLLRAWAAVEDAHGRARLAVAGEGSQENAMKALARRLGLERCAFIRPERNLAHYAAAADLTALSCLFDMHARLPIWSMACGVPIVAMEADGVRMNVTHGENGILVPVGDHRALAKGLLELIRDPERRRAMGEAGLRAAGAMNSETFRARARALLDELTGLRAIA